ncbi:hypothetical protein, partial [Chloroflexus sp.]|uniref:hypothetical protein n=1 Tax=Chloroflexus sp. TaxID=1904827 RepID=UPI002ACE590D
MALPTRAQLEAAVVAPTVTVEWHNGSAWNNLSQHVIRTRVQTSLPRVFDLGAASLPTATVTLTHDALSLAPAFAPIRISYGLVGTASQRRFVGYVTNMTRTPSEVVWNCQGVGAAIAAQS